VASQPANEFKQGLGEATEQGIKPRPRLPQLLTGLLQGLLSFLLTLEFGFWTDTVLGGQTMVKQERQIVGQADKVRLCFLGRC
jgi:hypothetical protein